LAWYVIVHCELIEISNFIIIILEAICYVCILNKRSLIMVIDSNCFIVFTDIISFNDIIQTIVDSGWSVNI